MKLLYGSFDMDFLYGILFGLVHMHVFHMDFPIKVFCLEFSIYIFDMSI